MLLATSSWQTLVVATPACTLGPAPKRTRNRYQRRLARFCLPSMRRPSFYRPFLSKGLSRAQFKHKAYLLTGLGVVYWFGLAYWTALRTLRKRVKPVAHLCWQSPITRIGQGLCQVHPP